jgi:acyl transferase domain-containing protein
LVSFIFDIRSGHTIQQAALNKMGEAGEWDSPRDSSTRFQQAASPIAIVGIGLRLPGGANSASYLWDFLVNKRSGRCLVPASRYTVDAFHKSSKTTGSVASRYGYFLQDDIDHFDASSFSMSRSEVERLDPQQRLLLEVVWECMESGGQKDWRGENIGCYVGVFGDVNYEIPPIEAARLIVLGLARYGSKRCTKRRTISCCRL